MFDKLDNQYSHMPFAALNIQGEQKQLCCLKRNDVWKVHYFDNGIWRKLATYTNEDACECGPTAEWRPFENIWYISFIAGGSVENDWKDVGFYLYLKRGFDDSEPVKICPASYGYVWKHVIAYGHKNEPAIHYIEDGIESVIHLKDIDYVYRLSYDVNNPDSMLISAQRKNGDLVTFSYILGEDDLYMITDNEKPCYKMCTWLDDEIYYCRKNDNDGFEDRHIVKACNIKKKRYGAKLFIEKIETKATDYATENFEEI